jgi:hypothetical protein
MIPLKEGIGVQGGPKRWRRQDYFTDIPIAATGKRNWGGEKTPISNFLSGMFIILKFELRFPRKKSKHFMESIWHVPNGIQLVRSNSLPLAQKTQKLVSHYQQKVRKSESAPTNSPCRMDGV